MLASTGLVIFLALSLSFGCFAQSQPKSGGEAAKLDFASFSTFGPSDILEDLDGVRAKQAWPWKENDIQGTIFRRAQQEQQQKASHEELQDETEDADDDPLKADNSAQFTRNHSQVTLVNNNNQLNQQLAEAPLGDDALREVRTKRKRENSFKQKQRANEHRGRETRRKLRLERRDKRIKAKEMKIKKAMQEKQQKIAEEEAQKNAIVKFRYDEENNKTTEARQKDREQVTKATIMAQEQQAKDLKQKEEESGKQAMELAVKTREGSEKKFAEEDVKNNVVFLQHPWQNYARGYGFASVKRQGDICVVSGAVRGTGGFIATLPIRCSPSQGRLVFNVIMGGLPARLDVLADGRVYHIGGGNGYWASLDGVMFTASTHQALNLTQGWQNFGGEFRGASASNLFGICMLSGMLSSGLWKAGHPWGHLIDDCTPADGKLMFAVSNNQRVAEAIVDERGLFGGTDPPTDLKGTLIVGGATFLSLDGIAWTQFGGSALPLQSGWVNFGLDWRIARYRKLGRICVVSGLIKFQTAESAWATVIATLPVVCRPQQRLIFAAYVFNSAARVDVLPNGQIHYVSGRPQVPPSNNSNTQDSDVQKTNFLSLSGIHFIAVPQNLTLLPAAQVRA